MRKPNIRHIQQTAAELAQQLADFDAVFTDLPVTPKDPPTALKQGDIVRALIRSKEQPLFLVVTQDADQDLFQGVVLLNLGNENDLKAGQIHTWTTYNYALSSWEEILQIAAILNAPNK